MHIILMLTHEEEHSRAEAEFITIMKVAAHEKVDSANEGKASGFMKILLCSITTPESLTRLHNPSKQDCAICGKRLN